MNEFILLATFLLMLAGSIVSVRLGKNYTYAFLACLVTIWVFLAPVITDFFGLPLVLTEIFLAVIFFTNHLMSEHHGKKDAHEAVWLVLLTLLTVGIISTLVNFITPAENDIYHYGLQLIFGVAPRLILAVIIMYLAEQHLNIWLFHKVKTATKGKKLWLRNLLSTTSTQLVDVLIFYPIAFLGVQQNIIQLMLFALVFKVGFALLDTPFLYWSHKFIPKKSKK